MEGLTTCSSAAGRFVRLLPDATSGRKQRRNRCLRGRRSGPFPRYVICRGGRDQPELDQWDQMELKFGRLLGEDPKLTMAKIMGRKANPNASYLDIEKSFHNNKGEIDHGEDFSNVEDPRSPARLQAPPGRSGSNADDAILKSVRSTVDNKKMEATGPVQNPVPVSTTQARKPSERIVVDDRAPNISLRKPTLVHVDGLEIGKASKIRIKPNLVLKMRKGPAQSLDDATLLKKPEMVKIFLNIHDHERGPSDRAIKGSTSTGRPMIFSPSTAGTASSPETAQSLSALDGTTTEEGISAGDANTRLYADSAGTIVPLGSKTPPVTLHGKPNRYEEGACHHTKSDGANSNEADHDLDVGVEDFASLKQGEHEHGDWRLAKDLLQAGERTEVELISCSSSGFVVSFGSLIGFLPYRNLGAKWKFLAFESWLRRKGLDPSLYRQNLSITGSYEVPKQKHTVSSKGLVDGDGVPVQYSSDLKFEDLIEMYDQEKMKFLSSFIGQMVRVSIVIADQNAQKIVFSGKPKEKDKLVEKKRNLMARLKVGDVVKCCIKKITYFGIFVEVDEVPALIHQSEISWDEALDPTSFFNIGQGILNNLHKDT